MATPDLETISNDLSRRFCAPLPEFHRRRIIFWYDEEREFEDLLGALGLPPHVEVLALTESNMFAVKRKLCADCPDGNFLVHDSRPHTRDDDNWLLNVQLYSEEFRADLNSIWMNEMGWTVTSVIRSQVRHYRKFFKAKERRESVRRMGVNVATAMQVHLVVMVVLAGCAVPDPGRIIRAVLSAGLDCGANAVYQSFVSYGADTAFWAMVAKATGYGEGDDSSLRRLATHILLTAATRTLSPEHLAGLDALISLPRQAYCYDFVSDWLRDKENAQLHKIAQFVEEEVRLGPRFEKLSVADLVATECFPCVDETILVALMREIGADIIQVDVLRAVVEKRRTMTWYDDVAHYYDGLLQLANMRAFELEHAEGFHLVEPQRVWAAYTADYHRMDTYYRQFHLCFQRSLKVSHPRLDDLFKQVAEKVEGLYVHWFLDRLGQNWSTACADDLARHGHVPEVPKQVDFYATKVAPSENRIFVVVSDALRYEVAASLSEQLQREMQCRVTLGSCQAIFPSVTKFGMAALLPHGKLEVVPRGNGVLGVLADGQSTEAGNRDKVLKATRPTSVALKHVDIIGLKRLERQALVKGMDVVYIYHDKVDEASHTSDSAVFPACDDAILEIKNLIRIIVNEFSGTNVIVTSDHGFLYTYSPLNEDDKLDKTTPAQDDVEVDRRYLITRKGAKPEYLLPVRFMDGGTEYDAFTPHEHVRIKKKGGGLNYVHGGISLQEMVVPVLEFQHLRNSSKVYQSNRDKFDTKPVAVSLLSASRKIGNMIFSLNFHQKEAVGENREPAVYFLYFTDVNGQKVSDVAKIIADKTGDNAQERTFRCNFNLRARKYSNCETYYLVIEDESGLQAPVREEFQIDIAFAVDGFDFFQDM